MTDVIDKAQEQQELTLRAQLSAQVGKSRQAGPSRHTCEECDEPIPEQRRRFLPGVALCVDCATRQEQRNRR